MNKLAAAVVSVAFLSTATIADARGGRTTAADCEAGSDDPDCPDAPAPPAKSAQTQSPATQPNPPPPRK